MGNWITGLFPFQRVVNPAEVLHDGIKVAAETDEGKTTSVLLRVSLAREQLMREMQNQ